MRPGKVNAENCTECAALRLQGVRADTRAGLDLTGELRVAVTRRSLNRKHRGIPATMTSASTCPPSCAFLGDGCFAEYHTQRRHWVKVPERGLSWLAFCGWVGKLPTGQLWRHNDAGDLPGAGDDLDTDALLSLVGANRRARARGFTFTHKPLRTAQERQAVWFANRQGFTVNLSADGLEQADARARLGVGPVAVVLPSDARGSIRTPEGRPVALCPAQTHGMTCSACQVCARPNRAGVVGFLAHGQSKRRVSELVQLRRKEVSTCAS